MKKLRLTVDLEYDPNIMHGDSEEAIQWFHETVLWGRTGEGLTLWSNEIGDEIGEVKLIQIHDCEGGQIK